MFLQYFCLKNKQASILVVCLWTIIILSILGTGLANLVFQEIKFVKAYQRLTFSLPIARAAVRAVFCFRQDDPTPDFDTFAELACENSQILSPDSTYKYYLANKISSADNIELIDEGALINLNIVSLEILKKLPGMDEETAEQIVNSGLRPFGAVNEVFLIEGMSKDKFLLFKDLVTVHGTGRININTDRKEVLLALGLDADTVEAILLFRREHKIDNPEPAAKEDLGCGFSDAAKIIDDLRNFASLSLTQEQELLSLLTVLDVKSEYLRLNVIPSLGAKVGLHYNVIINPATKKILSWEEH